MAQSLAPGVFELTSLGDFGEMKADRDRLLAELASRQLSLRAALREIDRLHTTQEPEIERLKGLAYKQADEIERLQDMKARLRIALHRNASRYRPELSHDEINAEIERIVRGDTLRTL